VASRAELIEDATIVTGQTVLPGGWMVVTGGRIAEVGAASARRPAADQTTSLRGAAVLPGFVDVHVHGGGGMSFGPDPEASLRAARFHLASGTTSLLAGIASRPLDQLRECVASVGSLPAELDGGGRVLGIHLEGPFISPRRKGAHDPAVLRPPDPAELRDLLSAAPGRTRLLAAAPELPGFAAMAREAAAAGVVISAGHTDASGDELVGSVADGVQSITHTFNGMRPSGHRDPGPLQAVTDTEIYCEIICDGIHVHPTFVRMLRRLAGARRVVLITDAVAWAGLPDGEHQSADRRVEVRHGRVVLAGTDTLAGSTLTMSGAVRRYWEMTGASLTELAAASSGNAARLLGEEGHIARLAAGYPADLVVLDPARRCAGVMAAGRWVREPGAPRSAAGQADPEPDPAGCACAGPSA
jgi:N-acetylglucosamine-6-phosphate deacetylase